MRKHWIIVTVAIFVFVALTAALVVSAFSARIDPKFFSSVDEFSHLEQYCLEEDAIIEDNHLEKSKLLDSYIRKIAYKEKTYVIYAYVFVDVETAQEYFNEYTGKHTKAEWNFSSSSNYFFESSLIAYHQNCLYRIEGGNYMDFVEAVNFIISTFSIEYDSLK